MVDYVTIGVVTAIIVFFIAIMYKALQEPVDMVIGWVKTGVMYLSSQAQGVGSNTIEVIKYD